MTWPTIAGFVRKRLAWGRAAALLAFSAAPFVALAQDSDDDVDPAEERAMAMEAAEPGAQTENVPGGTLMVSGYAVVWVLVLGYVLSLGFRQAKIQGDLSRLRDDIEKAKKQAEEG